MWYRLGYFFDAQNAVGMIHSVSQKDQPQILWRDVTSNRRCHHCLPPNSGSTRSTLIGLIGPFSHLM
jgi:hypothetical protein